LKKLLTFTEEVVRGPLIPRGKRRFSDNFPGLGVKHSDTGRRTYIFQSRLANGDQTTVQLGRVGLIKLTDAWELARQAYLDMRAGKRPNEERRHTAANTVERLVLDYCRLKLPSLRKPKQIESALKRDWLGYEKSQKAVRTPTGGWRWEVTYKPGPKQMLRRRPVTHVTKTELITHLDKIREDQKRRPGAASGAMVAIRAAFAWAAKDERYGLKFSPAAGLNHESVGVPQDPRERELYDHEIKAIWEAAGQLGVYGILIKLLFLTGCRLEEVGKALLIEITSDRLFVPKKRFKGKRDHIAPLVPLALQLLNELPRYENCPYVFSVTGRRAFSGYTVGKAKLDALSSVADWQVRDIRRTARTRLGRLGVPEEIAERVIGHSTTRLIRTYDVYDYFDEKKAALEKLAAHLETIISPPPASDVRADNVIQLRTRRG
jgi:integrase